MRCLVSRKHSTNESQRSRQDHGLWAEEMVERKQAERDLERREATTRQQRPVLSEGLPWGCLKKGVEAAPRDTWGP